MQQFAENWHLVKVDTFLDGHEDKGKKKGQSRTSKSIGFMYKSDGDKILIVKI